VSEVLTESLRSRSIFLEVGVAVRKADHVVRQKLSISFNIVEATHLTTRKGETLPSWIDMFIIKGEAEAWIGLKE
jgi:hypothetical protein